MAGSMGSLKRKLARQGGATGGGSLDEAIDELGRRLKDAKDFNTVSDWFHERVVPHPEFVPLSTDAPNERLTLVVEKIAERFGKELSRAELVVLRIARKRMWHGFASWLPEECVFFYFEELDMGLAAFSKALNDPMTHLIRFSLVELAGDVIPGAVTRGQA